MGPPSVSARFANQGFFAEASDLGRMTVGTSCFVALALISARSQQTKYWNSESRSKKLRIKFFLIKNKTATDLGLQNGIASSQWWRTTGTKAGHARKSCSPSADSKHFQ